MFAFRAVQFGCYVCAVAFLALSCWKRTALHLSETESFLSLMLILGVTLLFVCLGTLSGLAGNQVRQRVPVRREFPNQRPDAR